MNNDAKDFVKAITKHWRLGEAEITRRLARYGRVECHGHLWHIWPNDDDEFCDLTEFSQCERRYGFYTIVAHQLSRVGRLLKLRTIRRIDNKF